MRLIRRLVQSLASSFRACQGGETLRLTRVTCPQLRGETLEKIEKEEASHEEVLEVGTRKAVEVGRLVEKVVAILGEETK